MEVTFKEIKKQGDWTVMKILVGEDEEEKPGIQEEIKGFLPLFNEEESTFTNDDFTPYSD